MGRIALALSIVLALARGAAAEFVAQAKDFRCLLDARGHGDRRPRRAGGDERRRLLPGLPCRGARTTSSARGTRSRRSASPTTRSARSSTTRAARRRR